MAQGSPEVPPDALPTRMFHKLIVFRKRCLSARHPKDCWEMSRTRVDRLRRVTLASRRVGMAQWLSRVLRAAVCQSALHMSPIL
eukprot:3127051-Alexandrium_andersonii.AAC.1